MTQRNVELGVAAVQSGNVDEGLRLLKIALKSAEVTGTWRAIACMWLAEMTNDIHTKREYYNAALAADPTNQQVKARVEAWMTAQMLPPAPPEVPPPGHTPPPSVYMPPVNPGDSGRFAVNTGDTGRFTPIPPQPTTLPGTGNLSGTPPAPGAISFGQPIPSPGGLSDTGRMSPFAPQTPSALPKTGPLSPPMIQPQASSGFYHVVGVIGGPNGAGTAFFVAREGLLATSRYVVGGVDQVTVQLDTGRQLPGYVVRAFPEIDLAFIYVEQTVNDLIPVSPLPRLPDDAPLTVVSYNGQVIRGKRRATKRVLSPQWFPTDILALPDAGGCPVLDDRHYLIGMITRNTSSTSSYVYGLHINTIRQYVDTFRQETLSGARVYCPHCGHYSAAAAGGGYYCESCGAVTPQAEKIVRFPQAQTAHFYVEHSRIACIHCNATVGFHRGACLRCGQKPG